MKDKILRKIKDKLSIGFINVTNESYLHANHLEGGGRDTHFRIEVKSDDFKGKTLIQAHRMVNDILKDEFSKNGLHALSIKIVR